MAENDLGLINISVPSLYELVGLANQANQQLSQNVGNLFNIAGKIQKRNKQNQFLDQISNLNTEENINNFLSQVNFSDLNESNRTLINAKELELKKEKNKEELELKKEKNKENRGSFYKDFALASSEDDIYNLVSNPNYIKQLNKDNIELILNKKNNLDKQKLNEEISNFGNFNDTSNTDNNNNNNNNNLFNETNSKKPNKINNDDNVLKYEGLPISTDGNNNYFVTETNPFTKKTYVGKIDMSSGEISEVSETPKNLFKLTKNQNNNDNIKNSKLSDNYEIDPLNKKIQLLSAQKDNLLNSGNITKDQKFKINQRFDQTVVDEYINSGLPTTKESITEFAKNNNIPVPKFLEDIKNQVGSLDIIDTNYKSNILSGKARAINADINESKNSSFLTKLNKINEVENKLKKEGITDQVDIIQYNNKQKDIDGNEIIDEDQITDLLSAIQSKYPDVDIVKAYSVLRTGNYNNVNWIGSLLNPIGELFIDVDIGEEFGINENMPIISALSSSSFQNKLNEHQENIKNLSKNSEKQKKIFSIINGYLDKNGNVNKKFTNSYNRKLKELSELENNFNELKSKINKNQEFLSKVFSIVDSKESN